MGNTITAETKLYHGTSVDCRSVNDFFAKPRAEGALGVYFATDPILSVAILTEKGLDEQNGYIYELKATEDITIPSDKHSGSVAPLFFKSPQNVGHVNNEDSKQPVWDTTQLLYVPSEMFTEFILNETYDPNIVNKLEIIKRKIVNIGQIRVDLKNRLNDACINFCTKDTVKHQTVENFCDSKMKLFEYCDTDTPHLDMCNKILGVNYDRNFNSLREVLDEECINFSNDIMQQ